MHIFYLYLTSVSSLKLLQNEFPSKPFKAVTVNGVSSFKCKNLQAKMQNANTDGKGTCDANAGANAGVSPAPGSACQKAMAAAHPTFAASCVSGGSVSACKQARVAVKKAVAGCCIYPANTWNKAVLGATFLPGLNLPGNTNGAATYKCLASVTAAGYHFYGNWMRTQACVDLQNDAQGTTDALAEKTCCQGADSPEMCAGADYSEVYSVLTATTAPKLTPNAVATQQITGVTDQLNAAAPGAPTSKAWNAVIKLGIKMCSAPISSYFVLNDPSCEQAYTTCAPSTRCGGFCVNQHDLANSLSFYNVNTCYLEASGNEGTSFCFANRPRLSDKLDEMPKAFNDPKVVNMAGQSFEIMATGTFLMLRATSQSGLLLDVLATIDRAGSRCGATYIQNATILGKWITDMGVPEVRVSAAAAVPKRRALQVSIDGDATFYGSDAVAKQKPSLFTSTRDELTVHAGDVSILFSVDSHRIMELGKKTRRFANFLNMQLQGVKKLPPSTTISGLLASDDFTKVSAVPDECKEESYKLLSHVSQEYGTEEPDYSLETFGMDPTNFQPPTFPSK